MSHRNQKQLIGLAVIAIPLLFAGLFVLQTRIDGQTSSLEPEQELLLLRSGSLVKKLSLGYDPLLADIYWTRAIQYYGARVHKSDTSFDLLWPLLDVTTTLDPKLMIAYRFGAIFLSEPQPGGAGRPDLAVKLVERGISANPDEWRLYYDLGFLYYIRLKDYQKASEAFLEGSKNPKAYDWMKVMAAIVAQKGDALQTSELIWKELYTTTTDELVRKNAEKHIRSVEATIGLKRLNESSEDYWKKFGRYPNTIQELREVGFVSGTLKDPAGYPYVMGPYGVPQLDPQSPIVLNIDGPVK